MNPPKRDTRPTPEWRTLLFMPGDDMKKITKGAGLDVDAIIMDLEDGVALSKKEDARQTVLNALTSTDLDFGKTSRILASTLGNLFGITQPRKNEYV